MGRAGCFGAMVLAIVVIAGGGAWLLIGAAGAGGDPWREADGALAVSLLAALGEEYHLQRQGELEPRDDRLRALESRFRAHVARARHAAGPRVLALAILGFTSGPTRVILRDGAFEGYSVALASVEGAADGMEVGRGELRDGRPVLLLTKALRWTAHLFLDPDAPPAPATAPKRDERGVLAAALLAALAAEYHVLVNAERQRSGLTSTEERERAGELVPAEERQAAALDYVQRKEALDQRFQAHLAEARAASGTRCLGLVVESADPARPGRVLEAAGAGRFVADERFAVERGGKPTGIGIGLGTFGGKPALETRSSVQDGWSGKGDLPWSAHVWLNTDPRQAPDR